MSSNGLKFKKRGSGEIEKERIAREQFMGGIIGWRDKHLIGCMACNTCSVHGGTGGGGSVLRDKQ